MNLLVGDREQRGREHPSDISQNEIDAEIRPSHGISLDLPGGLDDERPPLTQHLSMPAYNSPLRHHHRNPSNHKEVKETLNARSEYTNNESDGRAEHHINQYIIKEEIGRGSFGAVHRAVDQYGTEYAIKEFSKSRLRKRAQSNILRRPHHGRRPGHLGIGVGSGLNSPLHRHSASGIHNNEEQGNSLFLIKEEIAIMKKLDHPNLVSLIEVLDDPDEDSLYMVLEMCKKGVVMKVGLNEKAEPYTCEHCRYWFRDLILGIEYLHAQGVVHRDIKPDNLLLTDDDVLKIVDFGVSEMFQKQSNMMTAKSAGSPAFLPPELCVTKHGDISGRAADIWSMGVSLYCLRFGRIPFERSSVLDLYEAIKNDRLDVEPLEEPHFMDLLTRLLEKDPNKRIKMEEIRDHPWVTKGGTDPLLSAEENTANLVEPPDEHEVNHAITARMGNLLTLMKAVKKFKTLVERKGPAGLSGSLGKSIGTLHLSSDISEISSPTLHKSKSMDLDDRNALEGALAAEGVHHDGALGLPGTRSVMNKLKSADTMMDDSEEQPAHHKSHAPTSNTSQEHRPKMQDESNSAEKGHAHDPLAEEPPFLGVGNGGDESLDVPQETAVAESPSAADFSIYDTAYQNEVERIRSAQGHSATVYLTRRVDSNKDYMADENMLDAPQGSVGLPREGWRGLLDKARDKEDEHKVREKIATSTNAFASLAAKAIENTRKLGKEGG